ncbi:hypothetical protein [Streptomyces sp. NPDC057910]|uniref:hypothetical protein n=1 Tax=Streptomyces sp. NPDC057910 TaxID=3346278 RepID=UPI0036EE7846
MAQNETDALARRVEAVEDRVEALQVQTSGNFAAVIEGQAAIRREVRDGFAKADTRFDALTEEVRSGNARIIEMLASLKAGRHPDTE